MLMEHPIATSNWLVEKTGLTPATVNKALGHLEQLGIVKERTARKRNRLFSYAGYRSYESRYGTAGRVKGRIRTCQGLSHI
jgi:predicted transcriptional regulator